MANRGDRAGRAGKRCEGRFQFADAVAKLTASIFPIFYMYGEGQDAAIEVCGTGFFVDDRGHFLTADHIMNCAPAGSTYYYYGKVPNQVSQPPAEIEQVASDPPRDLYLGRVTRDYLRAVEFAAESVRPGDFVCLSGYPMAVISIAAGGRFVGNIQRYWQPTFVVEATQAVIHGRRYDGYIVDRPCFSGMSGGPVFDVEGKVRGMGAGTLTRTIPEFEGEPMIVRNGIVTDVAYIRAFVEKHLPHFAKG